MESTKSITALVVESTAGWPGRGVGFAGTRQIECINGTRFAQRGQQRHEYATGFARPMQADHRGQFVEATTAGNCVVQMQLP